VTAPDPYHYTTQDLANEFQVVDKTIRKKARALGLGIDLGKKAGYRYNDDDRRKLIDSMKPAQPVARKRKRAA